MGELQEMLNLRWQHLLERSTGTLHFRFFMMPTVVSVLAIRAGLRDAREGRSHFTWTLLTQPEQRRDLLRSALKDIGRVLIVALVLDTIYQVLVLKAFYPGEALVVAFVLAVVPYLLLRGPTSVTAGYLRRRMMTDPRNQESRL
jgi:hypothetical protein